MNPEPGPVTLYTLHGRMGHAGPRPLAHTPERRDDRGGARVTVGGCEQRADAVARDIALQLSRGVAFQVLAWNAPRGERLREPLQLAGLRFIERDVERPATRVRLRRNAAIEEAIDERIPQPEAAEPETFEDRVVQTLLVGREHAGRRLGRAEADAARIDEADRGARAHECLARRAPDDAGTDDEDVGHAQCRGVRTTQPLFRNRPGRVLSIQPSLMNRPNPR